jgi:hypothetical protein
MDRGTVRHLPGLPAIGLHDEAGVEGSMPVSRRSGMRHSDPVLSVGSPNAPS